MLAVAIATGEFDRDCKRCDARLREEFGCQAPSPIPQFRYPDGEEVYRCPMRVVSPQAMSIVGAHAFAQLGLLPEPGGVLDQPAGFLRALAVVGSAMAKAQEEKTNGDKRRHA